MSAKIESNVSMGNIAEQLSRINGQLAVKNRRTKIIFKIILGLVISIIIFNLPLIIAGILSFSTVDSERFESVTQSFTAI